MCTNIQNTCDVIDAKCHIKLLFTNFNKLTKNIKITDQCEVCSISFAHCAVCTMLDYPISCTERFSGQSRTFRTQPVSSHFSSIPYNKKALPGVDEDCGCSILVARKCAWRSFGGSSSSKISSDLFPALLDSLTRILL